MYYATICKEGGAKKKKIQLLAHICIKSFWKEFYGLPLGMHQCSGTKIAPDWIQ